MKNNDDSNAPRTEIKIGKLLELRFHGRGALTIGVVAVLGGYIVYDAVRSNPPFWEVCLFLLALAVVALVVCPGLSNWLGSRFKIGCLCFATG